MIVKGVLPYNENFSTLVSLLTQSNLVKNLKDGEYFTVFAPKNEAFANIASITTTLSQDTLKAIPNPVVLIGDAEVTITVNDMYREEGATSEIDPNNEPVIKIFDKLETEVSEIDTSTQGTHTQSLTPLLTVPVETKE